MKLHHNKISAFVRQVGDSLGKIKVVQIQIHHRQIKISAQIDCGGGAGYQRLDIRVVVQHLPYRWQHAGKMPRAEYRSNLQPLGNSFGIFLEGSTTLGNNNPYFCHTRPPITMAH